jgi:hypothetical protein
LTHALPQLYAGQVLYIRGGDYYEDLRGLTLHPGSANDPILVQAYPRERPVLHGPIWLRQPSYWTISGLNVTWDEAVANPPRHLVKVTGGIGWTWRDSEIWGTIGVSNVLIHGMESGEPADWSFEGNCVHDLTVGANVNRGSNITVGGMIDAGPGAIERNLVFDVPRGRNLTLGYLRGGASAGPTDLLVRFNTLYDSSSAIRLAGDTSSVRIERNILGRANSGILIRAKRLRGQGVKLQQNLGVGTGQFLLDGQTGELSPNRAGNNLVDSVEFNEEETCDGFTSQVSVTLPYGKDAIG